MERLGKVSRGTLLCTENGQVAGRGPNLTREGENQVGYWDREFAVLSGWPECDQLYECGPELLKAGCPVATAGSDSRTRL